MEGFEDNEVFQTTSRKEAKLTGKKIIPNKEIYSRKYKGGKLTRHKYRHTARGNFLRAGVDYTEIDIAIGPRLVVLHLRNVVQ